MKLEERKALLIELGAYLRNPEPQWEGVKRKAFSENNWFIPEFIDLSVKNIAEQYLQAEPLQRLIDRYGLTDEPAVRKKVGIVMAGNIPLVGFHDLLCGFIAGHHVLVKPSSKDDALIRHLVGKMTDWKPEAAGLIGFGELLKGCDAYIATGSNNSARYFEHYFGKYPSIIRRNRTSVALLNGLEGPGELEKLADDVHQYFGLGCRNVTKLFVPRGYDFVPLLKAFEKYGHLIHHHKYKNNYDYQLTVHILNNHFYMTNGSILLVENTSHFSPISQLHYEFYTDEDALRTRLSGDDAIQCIVGYRDTPFGQAQVPDVCTWADGVDTMKFLKELR